MAFDERSRLLLYRRLQEVLGEEEATTLMEHLPPGAFRDIATKDDLEALRVATKADIEGVRAATKADLQELRGELLAEIPRTARNLTLSLTTIVAVLNGIVFTALKVGG